MVHNVLIFDHPTFLLEFESAKAKNCFVDLCNKNVFLLTELGPKACISPHTYAIIFCFIPCNGSFDPSTSEHLHNIKKENDLPANSLVSASCCKHLQKRSPNQATTSLKVACVNPKTANCLITGHIHVEDHLINVHKDIYILIHCIKCQTYGHTQDACIGVEKCANCASEFHSADKCDRAPCCVSCRAGLSHPSSLLVCPFFLCKSNALNECYPENSMPYFPTNENWTWATSPTNTSAPAATLPPPQQANPQHWPISPIHQRAHRQEARAWLLLHSQSSSHPVDNSWPRDCHQSTLPGLWGSQPPVGSSSNPQPNLPSPSSTQ